MKKSPKIIALTLITILILTIVPASALNLKIIAIESGEQVLLYTPPGGPLLGSVSTYLLAELTPLYGEAGAPIESTGQWQGNPAVFSDVSRYDVQYLGTRISGEHYFSCTVTTERTVKDASTGVTLCRSVRICSYLGYDDGDLSSPVPPCILWDTLEQEYPDGEEAFSAAASGK